MRTDPEAIAAYRGALIAGGASPLVVDAMSDEEIVTRMQQMLDALAHLGLSARAAQQEAAGDGEGRKGRSFYRRLLMRLRDNPGHDA
jgi:hypothetical protein